nr:MAG TPA: TRAF PROTEIN, TRAO PROTEIN, TRAN ADHESION, BACTERIAL SECRETION.5A [Caudoviricetes sp.]
MKRILLGFAALLVTGCCSCRKTIVFVGISSMASYLQPSVSQELRPSTPRFIPRNRRDSLFHNVRMASKRAASEATKYLDSIMSENKNSPDLGGVAKAPYRQALSLTTINESVDSLTKQVPCQHSK